MYHRPGAGRPSHSTSCGASPTFSTPRRAERYALSPETLIVNVSVGIPAAQNDAANPHTARPREMRCFIGLILVPDLETGSRRESRLPVLPAQPEKSVTSRTGSSTINL